MQEKALQGRRIVGFGLFALLLTSGNLAQAADSEPQPPVQEEVVLQVANMT